MGLMERPSTPIRPLKPAQLAILMSQPVSPCAVLPGPVQNLLHLVGLANHRQMSLATFSRCVVQRARGRAELLEAHIPESCPPRPPLGISSPPVPELQASLIDT